AVSDAPDCELVDTHSIPHSTGRDKEKALQQKSLQSLIFTQSGRRDLNPRPPEPHSGALPDCATSRPPLDRPRTDSEASREPLLRQPASAGRGRDHNLPPYSQVAANNHLSIPPHPRPIPSRRLRTPITTSHPVTRTPV